MGKQEIKKRLEAIVGSRNVSDSDVVKGSYTRIPFAAASWQVLLDFVVLVENAEQVSQILKLSNEYGFKVTPRGGFGMGGIRGYRPGVLIDTTLMNKVLRIDGKNAKAVAEGGCSLFKLAYEIFKHDLILPIGEYGPAPTVASSAHNPTVGFGNTRYGQNSDLVEGLEVVLPTGDIVRVGSMAYDHTEFGAYTRYITGPDFVGLFINHGGSLGIITKVAYRCLRRPPEWGFYTYYWPRSNAKGLSEAARELAMREVFSIMIGDRWRTLPEEDAGLIPRLPDDCWFLLFLIDPAESIKELKAREEWIDEICNRWGGESPDYNVTKAHWDWPSFFQPEGHPMVQEMHKRSEYGFWYVPDNLSFPVLRFPDVYDKLEELGKKYGLHDFKRQFALDSWVQKDLLMGINIWTFIDPYDKEIRKAAGKLHWEIEELYGAKGATWLNMYPPMVSDWA